MPELLLRTTTSVTHLRQLAAEGSLYAVLDACDEPRVPVKIRELGKAAASLYQGKAQEELWAIAPYIVHADAPLVDWLAASLWTSPWGIFVNASVDLATLRTHLRRFLFVDAPDAESWYFRFYDPRVLQRFLPTCSAGQLSDFFGPASAFGWVDLDTYGVTLARQAKAGDVTSAGPRIRFRVATP